MASAQAPQPWPRNPTTHAIEFSGHLAWPDTVHTEAQRQLLARRWYRQKLTNDKPETIRQFSQESGTTYAGVPKESCYRIRIMNADNEIFSLCFSLALTPDAASLNYRLSGFECAYFSYDAVTGGSIEEALNVKDAHIQSIMESFREQMLATTKGW